MKQTREQRREANRIRMRAARAADPDKYRRQAEAYRRRIGMKPFRPAMTTEERLAKGRERERLKRRAAGMKQMVVYPPDVRRQRMIEAYKKYRAKNAAKVAKCRKLYREKNAEKIKAYTKTDAWKTNQRRYRQRNPERLLKYWRAREDRVRRQMHPMHDYAIEAAMKLRCIELYKQTGIKHAIDHIIPIASCGWHHHDNLQILPAHINTAKHSKPCWFMAGYKSWVDVPIDLWPENFLRDLASAKIA